MPGIGLRLNLDVVLLVWKLIFVILSDYWID